ncbi:MAG: XRE family transcriptional regulator [Hyphomicrobiales bacterium]|nr:MAG: XRE family transcriptional regulator [Hyphomicrobiales bacterium]
MGLAQPFGRNVRRQRQDRQVTLEALADQVGLSYSYLGEIERGKRNPTLAVVERLADALKIDPRDLLTRS